MNMTTRLTESCRIALDLAAELELERGQAVIGSPWTRQNLIEYGSSRQQFIYCWTDDLASSQHYDPHEAGLEDFGETWCHYRVCAGIRYGIETTAEGVVQYRSKIIDHLTVDASLGEQKAVEYLSEVIDGLATRWASNTYGKLICLVDDRDTFAKEFFLAYGFKVIDDASVDGHNVTRMSFRKSDLIL